MKNNIFYKKVAIILAYYEGYQYIEEQLFSLENQTYKNFDIFIFDDNSKKSLEISKLKLSKLIKNKINLFKNRENFGYTKNFLLGLSKVSENYDYYCFCDQDDIWLPHKIERGISILNKHDSNLPVLYGTKTSITDSHCKKILFNSLKITRKLCFKNALLQNFAGGNTMMINKSARKIIVSSLKDFFPASHDWWTYIIVCGAGGKVIYDQKISLLYRQHNKSIMGSNKTWSKRLKRFNQINNGIYKNYIDMNVKLLFSNYKLLSHYNRTILEKFNNSRKSKIFGRIFLLINSGVYRQNFLGNIIVFFYMIFKKI